ncbi:MAG: hypothetical protein PVI38_13290 [Desulfobacterales bacterium]|jgi:kynurenine formamidase
MTRYIDLSHTIEDGMITYTGLPGPKIGDHQNREDAKSHYAEGTSFQIGKIEMDGVVSGSRVRVDKLATDFFY